MSAGLGWGKPFEPKATEVEFKEGDLVTWDLMGRKYYGVVDLMHAKKVRLFGGDPGFIYLVDLDIAISEWHLIKIALSDLLLGLNKLSSSLRGIEELLP